ncbi:hypothetical protein [Rhodophyticola sp.]|uniref:hypothetical protein n=1 Tax=Rhodophyticola sp. TaxID=2680032 RepID=UPI003D276E69
MQFQLADGSGAAPEHHRFLDVGCGSLRLGRSALMHLLRGRYFGVEPNRDILNAGVKMHFGADMAESQVIAAKAPTFTHNTDFDFSFTSGPVDYIFAQSIASHTGIDLTPGCCPRLPIRCTRTRSRWSHTSAAKIPGNRIPKMAGFIRNA